MWGWRAERDCHGHSRRIEHLCLWWSYQPSENTPPAQELQHVWYYGGNLGITGENQWFERYSLSVIAHLVWISDIYSSWQAKHLSLEIIHEPFFHWPVSCEPFQLQKGHIIRWSWKKALNTRALAASAVAICLKDRKTRLQLILGNLYSLGKGISVSSVLS